MSRLPHSTRIIPVPASTGEDVLTIPTPASRGGNGWAALHGLATGGSATTLTWTHAADTIFNDYPASALTTADRFNGSRIMSLGRVTVITDYAEAAGVATFTFASGALGGTPAAGQLFWVESDIPRHVAEVFLIDPAADIRISTEGSGLLGVAYNEVIAGQSHLLVDNDTGVGGFPVWFRAVAAAATTVQLRVSLP